MSEFLLHLQMHERTDESMAEQAMADMLYFTENEGRLRLDSSTL